MDYSYYENNKFIELNIFNEHLLYEIFSVYVETNDWYYTKIKFNESDEYLNHLAKLKSNSLYETDVDVNQNDSILILQTCSKNEMYKNYSKKYLLVIGKQVEEK